MIKLVIALLFTSVVMAGAQVFNTKTNAFYSGQELTFELAPTLSAHSFGGKTGDYTTGYSYESEYWSTENLGTGMEFGSYDTREMSTIGPVDHLAVIQDFRLVPSQAPIFDRLAFELTTGAETFFITGEKDIEFGLGADIAITKVARFNVSFMQHVRTEPSTDGWTLEAGLQWRF